MEDLVEKAKKLIENIPFITIASVTPEGDPWNSPVFAMHDDKYNFIWNSAVDAQHSKNVRANGKIFIVKYNSTVRDDAFGVYIEAKARELEAGEELESILKMWYEKRKKVANPSSVFLAPSVRRMYMATPVKVWVNQFDSTKTPPDWKEEIKLN